MEKKTVFVGVSGGVDSAVSATLLKKAGYNVVGVFIKTWHPEFLVCNEEEDRRDAMRVCAHLDIPFLTFDLEDVYKKEVADYMIYEYKVGRTPNPDVMCNKYVKFGAFLEKAIEMGADYVATGHYARIKRASIKYKVLKVRKDKKLFKLDEHYELLTGCDITKDQSYFLWTLNQAQLSKIIFPIGGMNKSKVRKLAKKFKLPVAQKKDSQGICFLGEVDLKDFLKHYLKEKKGKVLDESGEDIGHHKGVIFHTLGERHGFTITKKNKNDRPYYVVGKDIKKNILFVSQNLGSPDLEKIGRNKFELKNTNWILARPNSGGSEIPKPNKNYTAQIRYHGEPLSCQITRATSDVARGQVIFEKALLVAPGQSVVIYDGNLCLGGGIIV